MTPYLTERALHPPQIWKRPSPLLGMVVVIPCYDEDFILLSLLSLLRCDRPRCDVEVLIVVNDSDATPPEIRQKNLRTFQQLEQWSRQHNRPHLKFYPLYHPLLPKKHAGVGLARKIGMDEACYRLHKSRNKKGLIVCFDADSRCDPNYLLALEQYFAKNKKARACGVYFEHPLSGPDYCDRTYRAICEYELHLRYYVHAQRWAGFPHAWQTIGSSMAVRCDAYQQQGGMNRRQAGEDFYFLHKFIPLGDFGEVTGTRVVPSPRPSQRVPFGTGKAVGELLRSRQGYLTYHPEAFRGLRAFFRQCEQALYENDHPAALLEELPDGLRSFLEKQKFGEKVAEMKRHTANRKTFRQRFYRWFDAFLLMKYVHHFRDTQAADVPVDEAATWLLGELGQPPPPGSTAKDLLLAFRQLDRG